MKQYNKKTARMPRFGACKKYVSACMAAVMAMLLIRACDEYIIGSKPIVQDDTEAISTTIITTTATIVHTSTTTVTTTSITTTSTTKLSTVTSFISEYVDTTETKARSVEEYEEPETATEYEEPEVVTEYEEPEVVTEYEEPEQSGMYCIGSCYVTGYVATGYQTASGEWPYVGGCAMSSAYPLGTRIYIEGLGEYVVNDRGGDGIESGVIDIFCASTEDAYALTGYYTVYILEE